ncbi:MAG TPA: PEP-CTERM sorting domain-containing protein [Acetobacteraceae bacterium]
MTARKLLFGLLLLAAAWLTPYKGQQAHATTMTAAVTCFAGPCANDGGIRSNGVGILLFNRYAVLPFLFFDGNATLTGTAVVADVRIGAANFIYLYAYGVGTQSGAGGGFFLSSAITQNYQTLGGIGSFGAFNIGACNGIGFLAGDGAIMTPYVNGRAVGGGRGLTACTPFAQAYGPQAQAIGGLTNLTATDVMQLNGIAGGGAQITLPWGDDIPDPALTQLNTDINGDSPTNVISDLQALGLTQQIPEPATLALLGSAFLGLGALRRTRRA